MINTGWCQPTYGKSKNVIQTINQNKLVNTGDDNIHK